MNLSNSSSTPSGMGLRCKDGDMLSLWAMCLAAKAMWVASFKFAPLPLNLLAISVGKARH